MSPAVPIALAVLLGAAALWELAGSRGEELDRSMRGAVATLSGGHVRTLAGAALWLRVPQRLRRAGLAERVPVAAVLAGKAGGVVVGALLAVVVAPELSARLAIVLALALPAAGFVTPEALLERAARRRRARIGAALPDALDLLAVGTAAGRSPATVFGEISTGSSGPLASELAVAVAEIHCGVPQREAIAAVRERGARGPGVGARALPAPRLAARRAAPRAGGRAASRGAAPDRGTCGARGAEDPARRGAGAGPVGPADAPRRPGRSFGRPAGRRVEAR